MCLENDAFYEYLHGNCQRDESMFIRALTDKSYKNIDHKINDNETNSSLSTYGDAVLKLALCKILYEKGSERITDEKKDYETDKTLVEHIARHYGLIDFIKYDVNDKNIPHSYDYKGDSHKFIATAVEALLAVFFIEKNADINEVCKVVRGWMEIIDDASIPKKNKSEETV
ncbi:MAG: hypothetical protein J6L90_04880 [Clostridia bacterium]|nr:hypothetical protein [Clostridia bacterium]